MAKRRITDLIPEEAQKITVSSDENVIEVTATPIEIVSPIEAITEVKPPAPEKVLVENPINKDLEIQVKKLQDSLKSSQKAETNLRQEIADLEAKLLQQKQAADKFKKELGEAKKAAVHLADANSKLSDEIEVFKQEKVALATQEKVALATQEKVAIEKAAKVQSPQSQIQQRKQAEIDKSVAYRKSHRAVDRLPNYAPPEEPDDSMQMWLLD
jgi:chromosome segregation ATPase